MLYSMSRISTPMFLSHADMNHAAVASADIAGWNEAAQLATAKDERADRHGVGDPRHPCSTRSFP